MKPFLTVQNQAILKEAHRAARIKRQADRIKTILLLNKNYSYSQIASILLLDDTTIRTYFQEYKKGGVGELLENHYIGKQGRLTSSQEIILKIHLDENIYSTAKEIAFWVEKEFGVVYSIEGITHLLHRLGFVYKKTKPVPGKADLEKQRDFIKYYERIKKNKNPEDIIYFIDGVHPQHNSLPAYGWILKGKTKELKTNTGRKRLNLNGALNLENMTDVTIFSEKTLNAQATIRLFNSLEEKHQKGIIYAIVDNATYYKNRMVKEYLKTSRIKIMFLPPYSPNLNIIERLWLLFKKKKLNNRYYEKFYEFESSCLDFFKNLDQYMLELKTLLTDNFQLIGY